MINNLQELKDWLNEIANDLQKHQDIPSSSYRFFLNKPELAFQLIELINDLDEHLVDDEAPYYMACVLTISACVSELQSAAEEGHKTAKKTLLGLMERMAKCISCQTHSLNFWFPFLNGFYEAQVTLLPALEQAYFEMAMLEETPADTELSPLSSIRQLILELADLSDFDIAEHFFAQSFAMPPEFFADLVDDLYRIEEGHEIGLLLLLHPKADVREVVVETFDELIEQITLSPHALSRLKTIKSWYPKHYHALFDRWQKVQRKKGVVFATHSESTVQAIKASEVDGAGAQALFFELKKGRKKQLCGILVKQRVGIKEAWITPVMYAKELASYYQQPGETDLLLRTVDETYVSLIVNHFLAESLSYGQVPNLHLLEVQEALGTTFYPETLDIAGCIEALAVDITPFTPELMQQSLKRSKRWAKEKPFTETWYEEDAQIDKLVNQHCTLIEGIKVCDFAKAQATIFAKVIEPNRTKWLFHFLWATLWLKHSQKGNEKLWQDCFFIVYAIYQGQPLATIPLMQEICNQTILNSMETMYERKTHLSQG